MSEGSIKDIAIELGQEAVNRLYRLGNGYLSQMGGFLVEKAMLKPERGNGEYSKYRTPDKPLEIDFGGIEEEVIIDLETGRDG